MTTKAFIEKWRKPGNNISFIDKDTYYLILTGHWMSWKSDKERKEFYKDAKKAGIKKSLGKKMEWWYKK